MKQLKAQNNEFILQKIAAIDAIAIISIADLNGIITFVNNNFCKISGYSQEELIGKDHRIVNSSFHSKHFFSQMWEQIKSKNSWRGLIRNKNKNGEFYWVDSYIVPMFDENNNMKQYISFRFDVTAEKNAEAALEKEKSKNIHLSRLSSLGEMAAGVAHEINNPLAVIQGHLFLIERQIKNLSLEEAQSKKMSESVDKSMAQIKRMTKIINGLREFSRKGEEQVYENILFSKVIESVNDLCSEKLKKNEVRFEAVSNDFEFKCNQLQIEQVLVNLIQNAIDAIAELDDKWIKIYAEVKNRSLEINVIDSGPGISKEMGEKILQPFFTTKEIGKGTGLGLSISKDIIEAHGGDFWIDTEAKNTRFVISIPIDEKALIEQLDLEDAIHVHLQFMHNEIVRDAKSPETVCDLGVWIKKVGQRFKNNGHFLDLKSAHTEFHRWEQEVLNDLIANNVEMTPKDFATNERLTVLSDKIVLSLQKFMNDFKEQK